MTTLSNAIISICLGFGYGISGVLWYKAAWILHKSSTRIWFEKRGVILLWSFLFVTGIDCVLLQPLLIIFDSGLVDVPLWINNLCILIYWNIGMFVEAILVVRIILQFINVRRAELSDNWRFAVNPDYLSNWVIKYYHIFGQVEWPSCNLFYEFY